MGPIGSILSAIGAFAKSLPSGWAGNSFRSMKDFLVKNPSVSTALVPYTGGSKTGVLNYIRENKLTSMFLLNEVLGATGFTSMISEVFGDSSEGLQIADIVKQLTGDYDDPGRGNGTVDFAKMQDEFRLISSVMAMTSYSIDELIALRAVLSLKPGVFEQYMTFTENAKALM